MLKLVSLVSIPVAAIALASCAPISEDACRGGNWGSIGLEDGKEGKSLSILDKYAQRCAEFGVAPDQDVYLAARQSGLQFYCTPQNAYQVGRDGGRLNKVCQPGVQASISPAFNQGKRYYEVTEEIRRIRDRQDDLRDQLRALRDQTPVQGLDAQRLTIRSKIEDLRHDIFMLDLERDRFETFPSG